MARAKKQAEGSACADLKVWTNVGKNPVHLRDGSVVHPGHQTSPEQAEHVPGSLWEQHGVLVSGAPVVVSQQVEELQADLADAESDVARLEAENEVIRQELAEEKLKVEQLTKELQDLKDLQQ